MVAPSRSQGGQRTAETRDHPPQHYFQYITKIGLNQELGPAAQRANSQVRIHKYWPISEACRRRRPFAQSRRDALRSLLLGLIAAVLALGQVMSDAVVTEFLAWLIRGLGRAPCDPMSAGLVFLTKLLLVTGIAVLAVGLAVALSWAAGRLWRRARPGQGG